MQASPTLEGDAFPQQVLSCKTKYAPHKPHGHILHNCVLHHYCHMLILPLPTLQQTPVKLEVDIGYQLNRHLFVNFTWGDSLSEC